MRVAGLVLAAGGSARWGEGTKLMAPFRGRPLVLSVLRAAREAGLSPLLVVTGHRSEELGEALPEDTVPVPNPAWREGRASSVAAGIREARARPDVGAVVLLLGDEPRIRPEVVRAAVAAWREEGAELVRTVYRDRPGHPVLVDRRRFDDLAGLSGEARVRSYLERHADAVRVLRVDAAGPLDVDTREDHRRLAGDGEDG